MGKARAALAVFLVLVAGACSAEPTAPSPVTTSAAARASAARPTTSKPAAVPAKITAKYALGDFTTMDACSLVPTAKLPAKYHGLVEPQTVFADDIDDCQLELPLGNDRFVEVSWGELQNTGAVSPPDATHEDLGGDLILKRTPADASSCVFYLEFSDRVAMTITAFPDRTATADQLCTAGHDVAKTLAAALRGGTRAEHRIVQTSSLLHEDACVLLPRGLAESLPPVGSYPTHHTCAYGAADRFIELSFVRAPTDPTSVSGMAMTTVAGRATARSQTTFGDGTSACRLVTTYGQVSDRTNSSVSVEAVQLSMNHTGAPPCAELAKLAAKIWPKLPKQ